MWERKTDGDGTDKKTIFEIWIFLPVTLPVFSLSLSLSLPSLSLSLSHSLYLCLLSPWNLGSIKELEVIALCVARKRRRRKREQRNECATCGVDKMKETPVRKMCTYLYGAPFITK